MKIVKQNVIAGKAASFTEALLGWYDRNARVLPWRYRMGERPDPYRVWLSEVMLQQTTVPAVIPYFLKFTARWPDVHSLARAEPEALMAAWAGLGYYARARNLLACARKVSQELDGDFPEDEKALKRLPGIGDYTSAAIRAIAFNKPAVVVDGNVERVMVRIHPDRIENPKDKAAMRAAATPYYDAAAQAGRSGDMAQAFMDLGAGVCIPKTPRCGMCPVSGFCGSAGKTVAAVPLVPAVKAERRRRFGHVYWIEDGQGAVLLHKRPAKGLLGGMTGLPTSAWTEDVQERPEAPDFIQLTGLKLSSGPPIVHPFTHFVLTLHIFSASVGMRFEVPDDYFWHPVALIEEAGLPSAFMKAVKLLDGKGGPDMLNEAR